MNPNFESCINNSLNKFPETGVKETKGSTDAFIQKCIQMGSCAPNPLVLLDLPGGAERNLIH